MSWDIELLDENGKLVTVQSFEEGGTYVVGGSIEASLNVTWNYGSFYYKSIDVKEGIRFLDGKKAGPMIELLTKAVTELGIEKDSDYWALTSGNAGYALNILLNWAKQYPNATFKVS